MDPILSLYEDVKKKALMRLEYEGMSKCEAVVSEGARWFNDPAGEIHSQDLAAFAFDVYYYCLHIILSIIQVLPWTDTHIMSASNVARLTSEARRGVISRPEVETPSTLRSSCAEAAATSARWAAA